MSANICSICSSKMVKTVREMLRNHRGLSELRRIKAVFWWCYMHTKNTSRACRDTQEHA